MQSSYPEARGSLVVQDAVFEPLVFAFRLHNFFGLQSNLLSHGSAILLAGQVRLTGLGGNPI